MQNMAAAALIEKPDGAYTFSSQPRALQRNKFRYAEYECFMLCTFVYTVLLMSKIKLLRVIIILWVFL